MDLEDFLHSVFTAGMPIASHQRHFVIIDAQAKFDTIIRCDNDLDQWIRFFFATIEIILMRYYRSSFAIIFCNFRFFW